jgi:hypothetical protein
MFDFLEHILVWLLNHFLHRAKRPQKETGGGMLTLGFRVAEGEVSKVPVRLSQRLRAMHTAVFGKSGSGKTSFIKNLCAQEIRAGRGLFVLDLHGDLTPFILSTLAAEEWRTHDDVSERVLVISPTDREMSVGLNPLEGIGGDFGLTTEVAEVLRQHSHLDYLGSRTEELLRNAVLVLAANRLTLVDLIPLLTDGRFRAACLGQITNAEVRSFFESRYDKASEPMKATMREAILNKVSAFTGDPRFRHILGQSRSTFSMKDAMDRGCVVIAHLPKGQLGAQALTFASLLFTVVKNAIFTRDKKSLYTLILDEAQNLVSQSTDIETVLSEARKFGVGIVAANQFLDQYPTSMRAAILSVANFVCFQLSSVDAATLAQMLDGGKSLGERIKNLPPRHFILKSGAEHWVEAQVPHVEEPTTKYADLLKRSQALYARPRADIEREIATRHSALAATPTEALHDWD